MTDKEALRMALEAAYLAGFNASGEGYNGEYGIDCPEENAIWKKDRDNELKAINQALAAPVQEPVAWRVKVETKLRDGSVDVGYQLRNEKLSVYDEPLYTTPPAAKRPWFGLTDDEIFSVLGNLQRKYNGPPTEDSRVVFALAIEAKLKEKNT
jgi:hypothetical protein